MRFVGQSLTHINDHVIPHFGEHMGPEARHKKFEAERRAAEEREAQRQWEEGT